MARILVVDDEVLIGKTIEKALTKIGHTVVRVTNRVELQASIKSGTFDLLILDLHMPDMDPEEVVSLARGVNPGLRVLVVSGLGETEDRVALQKPFQIDELRQKVKELLDDTGC